MVKRQLQGHHGANWEALIKVPKDRELIRSHLERLLKQENGELEYLEDHQQRRVIDGTLVELGHFITVSEQGDTLKSDLEVLNEIAAQYDELGYERSVTSMLRNTASLESVEGLLERMEVKESFLDKLQVVQALDQLFYEKQIKGQIPTGKEWQTYSPNMNKVKNYLGQKKWKTLMQKVAQRIQNFQQRNQERITVGGTKDYFEGLNKRIAEKQELLQARETFENDESGGPKTHSKKIENEDQYQLISDQSTSKGTNVRNNRNPAQVSVEKKKNTSKGAGIEFYLFLFLIILTFYFLKIRRS